MITPTPESEMTTKQAADFLNVSRRFLLGLLESGRIPYRMDGGHHRLRLADVRAFKETSDRSVRRMIFKRTAKLLWRLSAWCNRCGNAAFMLAHPNAAERGQKEKRR